MFVCECGYTANRDLNAARNIEAAAFKMISRRSGFTETLNAQGQDVRPQTGQSWMNCENSAEERQPARLAI
jgi:Putative transposase DNA-binding domain.